jgi:hypothetical protein
MLAEFNTHRVFSRNSASSRAIPFKKMVKMVEDNPFIPIAWQKPHSGMQGTEYYDHTLKGKVGEVDYTNLPARWLRARDTAVSMAKIMTDEKQNMPITKQLANRILEPFMWHTVIVTATEWDNFFELRCPQIYHAGTGKYYKSLKDWNAVDIDIQWNGLSCLHPENKSQADIHIQAIAELMWDEFNSSTPKQLRAGEWHIPFGDNMRSEDIVNLTTKLSNKTHGDTGTAIIRKVQIATARCARISYQTLGDNPKIDYEADIRLHDMLVQNGHASPLEHVARAMSNEEYFSYHNGLVEGEFDSHTEIGSFFRILEEPKFMKDKRNGWCRNFRGFIQYRHLVETNA